MEWLTGHDVTTVTLSQVTGHNVTIVTGYKVMGHKVIHQHRLGHKVQGYFTNMGWVTGHKVT